MAKKTRIDQDKILKTGILPRQNGDSYIVVLQTPQHIEEVVGLQKAVFDALDESEKAFLIPRDAAYFEKHFEEGHVVLGVIHNDKLVAQSLMTLPTAQNTRTGMCDMTLPAMPEKIAVLNGTVVHPDYRGNNLQGIMTEARMDLAEQLGRTHIISEVSTENHYSWSTLMRHGLMLHSLGVDPDDGTKLYNMHAPMSDIKKRRLNPDFNKEARKSAQTCSMTNLEAQKILTNLGYRGIELDRDTEVILFVHPQKRTPAVRRAQRKASGPK